MDKKSSKLDLQLRYEVDRNIEAIPHSMSLRPDVGSITKD